MASPYIVAKRGTLEEFVASCEANPELDPRKYITEAIANRDPENRVNIVTWLLDQGADASYADPETGVNLLHIWFSQRDINPALEAPVIQRLLEQGADINGYANKWGRPLAVLYENSRLSDDDSKPLYDVVFAQPGIDWGVPANKTGAAPQTLRELIETGQVRKPDMIRRMHEYLNGDR